MTARLQEQLYIAPSATGALLFARGSGLTLQSQAAALGMILR
jgi:hypothetical protein